MLRRTPIYSFYSPTNMNPLFASREIPEARQSRAYNPLLEGIRGLTKLISLPFTPPRSARRCRNGGGIWDIIPFIPIFYRSSQLVVFFLVVSILIYTFVLTSSVFDDTQLKPLVVESYKAPNKNGKV